MLMQIIENFLNVNNASADFSEEPPFQLHRSKCTVFPCNQKQTSERIDSGGNSSSGANFLNI